ncbi:unnamed protein product [Thelazia callipaeda]|uniref:OTU domain-containing protein n=1 Tax=Thelazia callipaeda TaxID=103827 RepID=A0A0N5D747_THECL|nr:unnamed protein product [Thelazia callipaeda]
MRMKNSVAKTDKKQKKELAIKISEMEESLKNRHELELAKLRPFEAETSVSSDSKKQREPHVSKAQKRREKKLELFKKREETILQTKANTRNNPSRIEREAIENYLRKRGLTLHEIVSDGDCLYSAVAHQLSLRTLGEFKSEDIRQKASAYMRKHKDDFLPFLLNEDGNPLHEFEFDEYCMKVEKSCRDGGVWGGEPELRAISCALEWPVEVIQQENCILCFGKEFDSKEPLQIVFQRFAFGLGEHYNSTIPYSAENTLES